MQAESILLLTKWSLQISEAYFDIKLFSFMEVLFEFLDRIDTAGDRHHSES